MVENAHGRGRNRVVCFVTAATFLCQAVLAAPVMAATLGAGASGLQGQSLNLGSSSQGLAAPNSKTVDLLLTNQVGHHSTQTMMPVQPGQMITSAEYLAVEQILAGGRQSLVLNSLGEAVGGTAALSASSGLSDLSSLVVPAGVKVAAIGFSGADPLSITGQTTVAGSLFALQMAKGRSSTLDFGALSILNGGLLSGSLDTTGGAYTNVYGLPGLTLDVQNQLNNAGTISNGPRSTLTIDTVSGQITNSGTIETGACLTINGPSGIDMNAAGGTVKSDTGVILLSAVGTGTPSNILVQGGDFEASRGGIGAYAPGGTIGFFANRLDGPVSVTGANADVGAAQGNVKFASSRITNDPLFYAQNGDLDLSGIGFGSAVTYPDGTSYLPYTTSGSDFVALASGNITCTSCTGNNYLIDAATGSGGVPTSGTTGGSITLAAGVNFSVTGGSSPITCSSCGSSYQLLGPSATGGNVVLPYVGLRTNSGNISVQANSGSTNVGSIQLLNAESSGTGGAGGVGYGTDLYDGSNGSPAGNINIQANGTSSSATVAIGNSSGSGIDNGFLRAYGGGGGGAGITGNTPSAKGGNGGNGGSITVEAPGAIIIYGDVNSSGGGAGGNNTNGGQYDVGGNGGVITIVSGGQLTIDGPVLAAGGGGGGNGTTTAAGGGGSFGGGGGSTAYVAQSGGGIGGGGGTSASQSPATASGGGGFFGGGGMNGSSGLPGSLGQGGGGNGFGSGSYSLNGGGDAGNAGDEEVGPEKPGNGGNIYLSALGGGQGVGTTDTPLTSGVAVNGDIGTAFGGAFSTSNYYPESIMTTTYLSNSYGNIVISEPGYSTYTANVNLMSTGTFAAPITNTKFYIDEKDNGNLNSLSGTYGWINAGFYDTINGFGMTNTGEGPGYTPPGYPVGSGASDSFTYSGYPNLKYAANTYGEITVNESGSNQTLRSTSLLTPSEMVATLQQIMFGSLNGSNSYTGGQTLTLTGTGFGTGIASGGTFNISPMNIPSGGFTNLLIPAGVTAIVTGPGLSVSSGVTINGTGTLKFDSSLPGAGWLSTPSLTVNGSGTTLATNISFASSYQHVTDGAGTYAGVIVSPSGSDLTLTMTAGTSSAGIAAAITGGGGVLIEAAPGQKLILTQTGAGLGTTSQLTINGVSSGSGTGALVSDTAIELGDGLTISANNTLLLQTPSLVSGYNGSGTASSTVTATTAIDIQPSASQTGGLTLSPAPGNSATLNLNSGTVDINTDTFLLPSSMTLSNSTSSSTTTIAATTSIQLAASTTISSSGTLVFQTPSIIIGAGSDSGSIIANVNATTALNIQSNASQTGSVAISSLAGTQGELNVGAGALTITADQFEIDGSSTDLESYVGAVTIQAKSGDSLTLPASFNGRIDSSSSITFASTSNIIFANGFGAGLHPSTKLIFQSPTMTLGTSSSGSPYVTIFTGSPLTLQANSAQTGTLTITSPASSATLELDSYGANPTFIANGFTLGSSVTLTSAVNSGINIQSNAGTLTVGGSGTISNVGNVTLSSPSEIDLSNGTALITGAATVYVQAPSLMLGTSASISAGTLIIEPSAAGTGSLTVGVMSGSSTGAFSSGAPLEYVVADTLSVAANTTLLNNSGQLTLKAPGSDSFVIAGTTQGTIYSASTVIITSPTSISFGSGASLSCGNCAFSIQAPQVTIGTSGTGAQTATLSAAAITLENATSGFGTFTLGTLAGASSGTLQLTTSTIPAIEGDSLVISGTTTIVPSSGTVIFESLNSDPLTITASGTSVTGALKILPGGTLTLAGGTNISATGEVFIYSPTITIGTSGQTNTQAATISSNTGLMVGPSSGGVGTLTIALQSGVTSGTLNLNGAPVSITADSMNIYENVTLSSDQSSSNAIVIQSRGTGFTLGTSNLGTISSAGTLTIQDANSITFPNSSALSFSGGGSLIIDAPTINIGSSTDTGSPSTTITSAGPITVEGASNGFSAVTILPGANATGFGTMTLNGGNVTIASSDMRIFGINIASDHSITLQSAAAIGLTFDENSVLGYTTYVNLETSSANIVSNSGSLTISNGATVLSTGALSIQTPSIVIGVAADSSAGALSATIQSTGNMSIQGGTTTNGSLTFSTVSGATSGELSLSAPLVTVTVSSFSVSGSQTTVQSNFLTVTSDAAHSLTLPASFTGNLTNGVTTTFESPNSIIFANGLSASIPSNFLYFESPSIVIGASGDPASSTANIQQSSGSMVLAPSAAMTGTLSIAGNTGVTNGVLKLDTSVLNLTADTVSFTSGTTVQNDFNGMTIGANASGPVTVTGSGTLSATSTIQIVSTSSVSFANGTSLSALGNLTVQSPSIIIGASGTGAQSASLTSTGTIDVQAQANQRGTLSISVLAGASSGQLSLDGTSGNSIYCTNCELNSASISASSATVQAPTGTSLTIASTSGASFTGALTIESTVSDNFSAGTSLSANAMTIQAPSIVVGNGGSGSASVSLSAPAGLGMQPNSAQTGTLSITSAAGTTTTLSVTSSTTSATADSFSLGTGTTLSASGNVSIGAKSGDALTIPATALGTISTPNGSTTVSSTSQISFAGSSALTFSDNVTLQAPIITVGVSGDETPNLNISSSQQLTIQANSSQNGNLTINLVGGASSGIVYLSGTSGVFIVADSLSVPSNLSVASLGSLTIQSNSSDNLTIGTGMAGMFSGSPLTFSSANAISLANGTNVNVSSNLLIQAPSLIVGVSGTSAQTAQINSTAVVTVQGNSAQTTALSIQTLGGATSGTLILDCTFVEIHTTSFNLASGTTLSSTGSIEIESPAAHSLNINSGATGTISGAGTTTFQSDTSVTLQNGVALSIYGPVTFQTPSIVAGGSGDNGNAVTVQITSVGAISLTPDGGTSLSLSTVGSTGNLVFNGGAVSITANNFSIGANTTLTSNNAVSVSSTIGNSLTILGTTSGSISGTGTTTITSDTGIVFANSANLTVNGAVTVQSPSILVGTSGDPATSTSHLTATGDIAFQANAGQTGTLNFGTGTGVTSATLNITSPSVSAIAGTISTSSGALISSSALTITGSGGGDIGSSSSPLSISAATLGVTNTGTNSAYIADSVAVSFTATVGGQLTVTDPTSITIGGTVTGSSGVTLNTPVLTNNNTIIAGNTNASILIENTNGSSLQVGGSGTYTTGSSGNLTLSASSTLILANGTDIQLTGGSNVIVQAPSIVVGTATDGTGALSATIDPTGTFTLQPNSNGTGSLNVSTVNGATSGTLNLDGGTVTTESNTFSISFNTTIASDQSVNVTAPSGNSLTIGGSSGGTIDSSGSTTIQSDTSVSLANGGSLNVTHAVTISAPTVTGGTGSSVGGASINVTVTGNGNGDVGSQNTPLSVNTGNLSISNSGTGSAFISDSAPVNLTATVGGQLRVTDTTSITTADNVTGSSGIALTTPALTNSHTITAGNTNASISITSPNGSSLTLNGSGTVSSGSTPTDGSIFVNSPTGSVTFNGSNTNLNAGTMTVLSSTGNVNLSGSNQITSNGTLQVIGNFVGNTANVIPQSGTATIIPLSSGSTVGTIANPSGNVVLSKNEFISTEGKSLVILASGSVIAATGLASIDLSSSTGNAGSLTIYAGVDITSGTPTGTPDTTTTFQVSGGSQSGGNIYLANTSVSTSSTAPSTGNDAGGNVLMVAYSGNANAGTIYTGAISTASTNGTAGSVTMLAGGGIVIDGAVNAKGASGGGNVFVAGISLPARTFSVFNGLSLPTNPYADLAVTPSLLAAAPGSAVQIDGAVMSSSTKGSGGSVTLAADRQVVVAGAIDTSGLLDGSNPTAGGGVDITSAEGFVTTSTITTSASAGSAALTAGFGGSITIFADSNITTGTLATEGAENTGLGEGGTAGSVSLTTGTVNVGGSQWNDGAITVKGYIDMNGGAASKSGAGTGGQAGSLTAYGATVAVTSKKSGASILAVGGAVGATGHSGGAGGVTIETFGLQAIPADFDLTSTKRSIPAVPGEMFSVGQASPVNGVAGTIVTSTTISPSSVGNDGEVDGTKPFATTAGVSITTTGSPVAISDGTFGATVSEGGKRQLVTPAEAVALFQNSRSAGSQTIGLSTLTSTTAGADATGVAAPGDPVDFTDLQLSGITFVEFKDNNVPLSISGALPVLDLPTTALIASSITFTTDNATDYINAGAGKLTVGATGSLLALTGTLIISGTGATWTNNGTINAANLVLARPSSARLTFVGGAGSTTTSTAGGDILIGTTVDVGLTMTFKANGVAAFDTPVDFANVEMPAMYTANGLATAKTIATLPAVSLSFELAKNAGNVISPIVATVSGSVAASKVSIAGLTFSVDKNSVSTPIQVFDGTNISSAKTMTISSTASVGIGDDVQLTAGTADTTINVSGTNPQVTSANITSSGSIAIKSTGAGQSIIFGDSDTIDVNGSLLSVLASGSGSTLNVGTNNQFQALGGNITILSKGVVTNGAGNSYWAEGTTGTSTGGVEIGAGLTAATLGSAFGKPENPPSPPIGTSTDLHITNNGGALIANDRGGTIDLTNGGATATLTLNQGAIVLDGVGAGNNVTLNGASIMTRSSKPVSMAESEPAEIVVDADIDAGPDQTTANSSADRAVSF